MIALLSALLVASSGGGVNQARVREAAVRQYGLVADADFSIISGITSPDDVVTFHRGEKSGTLYAYVSPLDKICTVERGGVHDEIIRRIRRPKDNELYYDGGLGQLATDGLVEAFGTINKSAVSPCMVEFSDLGFNVATIILTAASNPTSGVILHARSKAKAVDLSAKAAPLFFNIAWTTIAGHPPLAAGYAVVAADRDYLLLEASGRYSVSNIFDGRVGEPHELVDQTAAATTIAGWKGSRPASIPNEYRRNQKLGWYGAFLKWATTSGEYRSPEYEFRQR